MASVSLTLMALMYHFPRRAGKEGLDIVGPSVYEDKGAGLLGKWPILGLERETHRRAGSPW